MGKKKTIKKPITLFDNNNSIIDNTINTINIEKTNIVSSSIEVNKNTIKQLLQKSVDIIYYEFETFSKIKAMVVYIEGIINKEILDRDIIGRFIKDFNANIENSNDKNININEIKSALHYVDIRTENNIDNIIKIILNGTTALFIEGLDTALIIMNFGWERRAISEPQGEVNTKGPKEGFVESLFVNRSLMRRKIKNPNLVIEELTLGKQTNTIINLIYIHDIVNTDILEELKIRLNKIDIDGILDSGYIEELISDSPLSPFNTIGYTERPEIVAGKILEGRIAILCDGSPIVLTVPFLFLENFQVGQDYSTHFIDSSIERIVRWAALFLTIFTPGIYIALVSFHQEMLPEKLLMSFIASRSGVPLPTLAEVLIMIFAFDILRESGLRLPKALGQTVSIVGALILGQAAVEAKFVSAPVVIIIAVTAISSFVFFRLNGAILVTRILVILASSLFGLYGTILSLIVFFLYLFSIRSFGVLYMSYIGSLKGQEVKDTIIRAPWWYMHLRPTKIALKNVVRKGRV